MKQPQSKSAMNLTTAFLSLMIFGCQTAQTKTQGEIDMNRYRYQSGQNKISFQSEGKTLKGDLFLPASYEEGKKLPVIVVTGSWTTVKEQMAGLYARKLSEKGYATLVFDFRGFGESEGTPRQYESATEKEKDIQNAITFASKLPILDHSRIGALSICATSGYMAEVAGNDDRLKSLTFVAPWLHNGEIVKLIYGGEAGVKEKIKQADEARTTYEESGKVKSVPAISTTNKEAAMFGDFDYYLNPRRGAIPEWKNEFAVMSWRDWLTFDGVAKAKSIHAPVLIVHSKDGAVPQGAEQFYDELKSKKNIIWLRGTQFDFYDQEPNVSESVELAAKHFAETL